MPKHPFEYHRPGVDQIERIDLIRKACNVVYETILHFAPPSAERTLAIGKLEECRMWADKSIILEKEPTSLTTEEPST